jgi:carbamoyltransferase
MKPILGIWDGHDSGAGLVENEKILFAVNEERLTRRKLEMRFPEKSIAMILRSREMSPEDVCEIAVPTYDFAKTLARIFPYTKEEYYLIRRRKKHPGRLRNLKKRMKYKFTEFGPNSLFKAVSRHFIAKRLKQMGFKDFRVHLVNHHLAHAASAAFCSGFDSGLILTLDGIGDGLSGSVSVLKDGNFKTLSYISGRDSFGIFFEHITNSMNMREGEDEGKVMALANYAYPIKDEENPLLSFFKVEGLEVKCRYETMRMYNELQKILWFYPSEQFAYMAQRTLEVRILELVKNAVKETGLRKIAIAGGVASNVKVNMLIRNLPEVDDCFIFPHMGDGGLALGAAMLVNYNLNGVTRYDMEDVFLGPDYTDSEIEETLKESGLQYRKSDDIVGETAGIIAEGGIVLWFQGSMELGPRALGNRSILALADSQAIKDRLNIQLKKRVWYQPFCPTMLEEDARVVLEEYNEKPDRFMTMGFMVKPELREGIQGVINIDGSCRPQIIPRDDSRYSRLLQKIKELTGKGVVLDTSLNVHGDPMVCSPEDAVETLGKTGSDYLIMGDYLVWNERKQHRERI